MTLGTLSFLDFQKRRPWQDRRDHLMLPLHFTEERMTTQSFGSVQRSTAESRWEAGNKNAQEKSHFSTLHSLLFNKWAPSHARRLGDNTAGVPIKHSMAIMNTCHVLTTKHYFLKYSDSFCGISSLLPEEVLVRGSVQTPALPLWKLKQTLEFLLPETFSLTLQQPGADIRLGPMILTANLAKTTRQSVLLLRLNTYLS